MSEVHRSSLDDITARLRAATLALPVIAMALAGGVADAWAKDGYSTHLNADKQERELNDQGQRVRGELDASRARVDRLQNDINTSRNNIRAIEERRQERRERGRELLNSLRK